MTSLRNILLAAAAACLVAGPAAAVTVSFSSASATFNQNSSGVWDAPKMIDGIFVGNNGWAVFEDPPPPDPTNDQIALLSLTNPLAGSYELTLNIYQNYPDHNLGDFSFGYTTDGGATPTSTQTALTVSSISALSGRTFSFPGAGRVLATGSSPMTDLYTVTLQLSSATPVTGLFLNVFDTPGNGLPFEGPGDQITNGNFVVSEITASAVAVPEPGAWALMILGFGGVGAMLRRRAARAVTA